MTRFKLAVPLRVPMAASVAVSGEISTLPAWLSGAAVGEWVEITGTTGAGSAAVDPWGAIAVRQDTSEVFIAASGGHLDSGDNRVVSCDLSQDSPSWTTRTASTASPNANDADGYYDTDGLPISRHLYHALHWVPSMSRLVLVGCRFGYGSGTPSFGNIDGWSPATGWDAAATWANYDASLGSAGFGVVQDTSTGDIWTNAPWRYDVGTDTMASESVTGWVSGVRTPAAYDSLRHRFVWFQYGDGEGGGTPGLVAQRVDIAGGTAEALTINLSLAYTQWLVATPTYAGMDYDPDNDRFLFYHGGETGVVYVLTPATGTAWDLSILSTTGTPAATPGSGSGINARFKYVSALKGFVLLPQASANLWFLRVA